MRSARLTRASTRAGCRVKPGRSARLGTSTQPLLTRAAWRPGRGGDDRPVTGLRPERQRERSTERAERGRPARLGTPTLTFLVPNELADRARANGGRGRGDLPASGLYRYDVERRYRSDRRERRGGAGFGDWKVLAARRVPSRRQDGPFGRVWEAAHAAADGAIVPLRDFEEKTTEAPGRASDAPRARARTQSRPNRRRAPDGAAARAERDGQAGRAEPSRGPARPRSLETNV